MYNSPRPLHEFWVAEQQRQSLLKENETLKKRNEELLLEVAFHPSLIAKEYDKGYSDACNNVNLLNEKHIKKLEQLRK